MSAGVLIDWAGDGFGTGANDDVTANVIGWNIKRGAAPEITGQASIGSMTLVLKNPANIYNPEYGSSPIHAYLHDGPAVWVGIKSDGTLAAGGTVYGLFGGRITDISPIPAGGAAIAPTVEIVCEDALAWYGRQSVLIADSTTRTQQSLRQAVLDAIGETHYTLATEPTPLPLSSASGDALGVLSGINAAGGTRHFIKPGATATDWYSYVTVPRMAHLSGVADSSISAASQHVTDVSGWRKTSATVINHQAATVEPISFPTGAGQVWAQETGMPMTVVSGTPVTVWANFTDFVKDAQAIEEHSGSSITVTLTPFGTAAKLVVSSSGTSSVTSLIVLGRQVIRGPMVSVIYDDVSSQAQPRGIRSGSEITGDFVGTVASAVGIASHMVWRYAQPLSRPTAVVANWFPDMFVCDLYDVLAFTSPQLAVSGRLMEIVGLEHVGNLAASTGVYHVTTYQLQESRVQTPTAWFTWNTDHWTTGPGVLGY